MPGTGHSSRHKGSITGRSSKSAFQVLAPWNSRKNGDVNQVPVSSGGGPINFKLLDAKMMSNYDKNKDEFTFDCSLNVTGSTVHTGDVQYQGNLTIDGVLNAQTALIQDLSAVNITDVCDNVLTLGNHESFSTKHMRGIFMSHLDNSGTSFTDEFSFMGFDPCGNTCGGLASNDTHGQFVFLTDASFNSQAGINDCNIKGEAGRVVVGTLDISGSSRYGDGSGNTGLPTQDVSGQANSSMHLVGRTIIAQDGGGSAQLDISGGVNVTGSSKLTDSGNEISLNTNASTNGGIGLISDNSTTADPTIQQILIHNKQGTSPTSVFIKSDVGGIDMVAATDIALGAGQKIDIGGNASEINIGEVGATVDISGTTTTLDGTTSLKIGPDSSTISIGNNGATVDISGDTIDISGTTSVKITADVSGTNIKVSTGVNPNDKGVEIGNAQTLKISGTDSLILSSAPTAGNPDWGQTATNTSVPCGRIKLGPGFPSGVVISAAGTSSGPGVPGDVVLVTLYNSSITRNSIILLTMTGDALGDGTGGNVSELIPSVQGIFNGVLPVANSATQNPAPNNYAVIAIKNTGTSDLTVSPTAIIYINFLIINPSPQILSI